MPGESSGSVTLWIGSLKAGDSDAATALWDRYFRRVVALARAKLGQAPCLDGRADEEDTAISAFFSLCQGAASGRFLQLEDRNDLWQLLAVITTRKALDLRKWQGRIKRGGGRVVLATAFAESDDGTGCDVLERIALDDPAPDLAAMLAEEYRMRLDSLGDETLRRVAQLRFDGYNNDEIAEALGCARRTVARKIELIRDAWKEDAE